MIEGTVLDGVPTITLSIADREHTAIIDTGFNGDLELPVELHQILDTRYVGRATSALAGGQVVEEDMFLVDFPFDGRIVQAETTFVADDYILIGTHLLAEYFPHLRRRPLHRPPRRPPRLPHLLRHRPRRPHLRPRCRQRPHPEIRAVNIDNDLYDKLQTWIIYCKFNI